MKNIVKDIEQNCPECSCNPEKTIEFLQNRGDLSYTSDHYREINFFYLDSIKMLGNKAKARQHTLEIFRISNAKFKVIRAKLK